MSNAAKYRKKATEYEQLRQTDRAIAAYIRAIEESESAGEEIDVTLFNKVGDLALRQGRVPDAITYYERAVEHYVTAGLANNAIALCNKILRNAPGRANVYFTLGRICARKGLRGDATRNFLEYATRMQQDGRVEEGMRALAEVADIMPELTEIQSLVEEHAAKVGITLPRRRTPLRAEPVAEESEEKDSLKPAWLNRSSELVFLDVDYGTSGSPVPPKPAAPAVAPPVKEPAPQKDAAPDQPTADSEQVGSGTGEVSAEASVNDADASHGASPADEVDEVEPENTTEAEFDSSLEQSTADAIAELADIEIAPAEGFTPTGALLEALPEIERVQEVEEIEEIGGIEELSQAGRVDVEWIVPPEPEPDSQPYTSLELPVDGIEAPALELIEEDVIGADLVMLDLEATETAPAQAFRIDPHDFVQSGELQPLVLSDDFVDQGIRNAVGSDEESAESVAESVDPHADAEPAEDAAGIVAESVISQAEEIVSEDISESVIESVAETVVSDAAPVSVEESAEIVDEALEGQNPTEETTEDAYVAVDAASEPTPVPTTAVRPTPSLPTAAIALEAHGVASARRDSLKAAVVRMPQNWLLRRRLAEALFESGDREAALHELETAQRGLIQAGELQTAADIANELVQVEQDRIGYHQKRVELAVRLSDQRSLQTAYLDLADALVRMGEEGRARAVYARVLEIDPYDDRARAALGAAAPPPPPPPPSPPAPQASSSGSRPDDKFVDLASWLSEGDEPASTRMRMREPTISGDEQADFDALLERFKEGVSRSLGDDDFEGHYDLGVAYKEMGLLDDAIGEFQKALRSRTHRLAAYEALGQCFVEQERFQVAATVLTRALHEPGLDDEQRIGVLYMLGHSCEALQRRDDARGYFQRVYATDIQFRDVAARLAALDPITR